MDGWLTVLRQLFILVTVLSLVCKGTWWSLSSQLYLLGANLKCDVLPGISFRQRAMCFKYHDHMNSVGAGAKTAMNECKRQFQNNRWNCSIWEDEAPTSTPVQNAAGVVYRVAQSCKDGDIPRCGCSRAKKPANMKREFIWGGCGDNVEYGLKFARTFVDIKEREQNHPRRSNSLAHTLMNLHNNEAGRRAVFKNKKVSCKCHGVSGSCSLRTCWYQLPSFAEIGNGLKRKYASSTEATFNKRGTKLIRKRRRRELKKKQKRKLKPDELVFMNKSPDYCDGAKGRRCNPSTRKRRRNRKRYVADDTCDEICCGRGSRSQRVLLSRKCRCRFHWCCYVKCDQCNEEETIHTCL